MLSKRFCGFFAALFLAFSGLSQGTIPNPEVLYYSFDGTGTNVPNKALTPPSGTDTAVIAGSLSQGGSGQCGGALIGTGNSSAGDYLNTGWVTNLTSNDPWTISFWTSNIAPSTTLFYIFGDVTANSFRCFTNGVAGSSNWILRGGSDFIDVPLNGAAITTPTMATFVYDTTSNTIYAYMNGTLVNSVVQGSFTLVGAGPFKVGGYSNSVGLPAGGLMDEFRLYSHALTPAEVTLLYNRTTYGVPSAVSACESYESPSGNYTWTTSGTYMDTLTNAFCGDSVLTINLTINQPSAGTISPVACGSYESPSGLYSWTTSGTYMDTLTNAIGCDSVITVNLTINMPSAATISPVACSSYESPSGLYNWTTSGTYMDTLTNAIGCDSVITINLTVNMPAAATISPVACSSYESPSGLYNWTTSGTYMDTIPNVNGCDSVITINLTVNMPAAATISPVACSSYESPSGLYNWTTSGTYMDTIPNVNGCDSVITINLTVNMPSAASISRVACGSYESPSGLYNWTASGTYMDTIPNAIGCDSVITVNLTVNMPSAASISPVACSSYESPSGNYSWTISGTYMDTIPNAIGCDSVITVNLTIHQPTMSTISVTECDNYLAPDGTTHNVSGQFTVVIPNANSCDSVITINLTLVTIDTAVTQTGGMLSSVETGVYYQWIDCATGQQISGATNQWYMPGTDGSYSVEITGPICTRTSGCHAISFAGLSENEQSALSVFPNPVSTELTILNPSGKALTLELFDSAGKLIGSHEASEMLIAFDMRGQTAGIYLLKAASAEGMKIFRIVKN